MPFFFFLNYQLYLNQKCHFANVTFTHINFLIVKPYSSSKCGPWTNNISISWDLVSGNADTQSGPSPELLNKNLHCNKTLKRCVRCQEPWLWNMETKALYPGTRVPCCLDVSLLLGIIGPQFPSVISWSNLTKQLSKVSFATNVLGIEAHPNTWNHLWEHPDVISSECITSQEGLKEFLKTFLIEWLFKTIIEVKQIVLPPK